MDSFFLFFYFIYLFIIIIILLFFSYIKFCTTKRLFKCRSFWGVIPKYCDASPNTAQDLGRLLEICQEDIGPRQWWV